MHHSVASFSSHVVPDAFHALGPDPADGGGSAAAAGSDAAVGDDAAGGDPSMRLGAMDPMSSLSRSVCSRVKYDVVRPSLVFLYPRRAASSFSVSSSSSESSSPPPPPSAFFFPPPSALALARRSSRLRSSSAFLAFFLAFSAFSSFFRRCLSHSSKETTSWGGSLSYQETEHASASYR